jgi:drug/metabolite transporter (DMT)-like permease
VGTWGARGRVAVAYHRGVRGGERLREWLAFGVVCLVWGSTYLAIKVGLASFTPFWFAALRYWVAAPLAAVWAARSGVRFARPLRQLLPAFGVGVLFIGLCNGMVFWAETVLDSAYTALLITASPLWTALLTWAGARLLEDEGRLGSRGVLGLAVGFAGSWVLLQPAGQRPGSFTAALVVELSVVIWAIGALWVRRVRDRFHPLELTTWQMVAGAAFLTLLAVLRGDRVLAGPLTGGALAAFAYLVLFGSLAAFAAYFFLLRVWPATRVATSAYVNPVVAVVLGWLLLGERISPTMLAGGAAVLVGVFLVLSEPRAPREER